MSNMAQTKEQLSNMGLTGFKNHGASLRIEVSLGTAIGDDTPHSPLSPLSVASHSLNASPVASPEPAEYSYGDSVGSDFERAFSFEAAESKGVKFPLCFPEAVNFTVSLSVDEHSLRRPGKLFPLSLSQSTTVEPLVLCPETLALSESVDIGAESKTLTAVAPNTAKRIELLMEQKGSLNSTVSFDKISVTASNRKTVLLSSRGLSGGRHEWSVKLLRCDVNLQEIGVISTDDIDRVAVSDSGANATAGFKSRALYGSDLCSDLLFYGSWNRDGSARCLRDLRANFRSGWTVGSVVTVKLDLKRWTVKFLLNGSAVRYTISLEPHKTYHPVICTQGDCRYFLL